MWRQFVEVKTLDRVATGQHGPQTDPFDDQHPCRCFGERPQVSSSAGRVPCRGRSCVNAPRRSMPRDSG